MSTLIILRHGEKPKGAKSSLELSSTGKARAQFLAKRYLGRDAKASLFGSGKPHAFFAITPHTIQTASPSAESWSLPVTAFCTTASAAEKQAALDIRTQDAAKVVARALAHGRDVVVVWEHHRIADARIGPQTTLWKLLNLGRIGVPDTWPDDDYDSIWSIDCDGSGKPKQFRASRQHFRLKRKPAKPSAKPKKSKLKKRRS